MIERKWLPSFGELVDRLSICQLKEFLIPENRDVYTDQIKNIVSDLDSLCKEREWGISGKFILAVINVAIINRIIWENEANQRKGIEDGNNLKLTHSLNTIRTSCYSIISEEFGDRQEFKKDTLIPEANWIPSLLKSS